MQTGTLLLLRRSSKSLRVLRGLEIFRRECYWYSMAILLSASYPPQLGSDFSLSFPLPRLILFHGFHDNISI